MNLPSITDLCGWIGMILLLTAYGRQRTASLRANALTNLVGAAFMAVMCVAQKAWPALALQSVWAAIAIRDLIWSAKAPTAPPR